MDEFMDPVNETKANSEPPPIRVQQGNKGTSIRDVKLDVQGDD